MVNFVFLKTQITFLRSPENISVRNYLVFFEEIFFRKFYAAMVEELNACNWFLCVF